MSDVKSWEWREDNVKILKDIWLFSNDVLVGCLLGIGMFMFFFHILPMLNPSGTNEIYVYYAWFCVIFMSGYGSVISKLARRPR